MTHLHVLVDFDNGVAMATKTKQAKFRWDKETTLGLLAGGGALHMETLKKHMTGRNQIKTRYRK